MVYADVVSVLMKPVWVDTLVMYVELVLVHAAVSRMVTQDMVLGLVARAR